MKARPGKPVMRRLGCMFVAGAALAAIVGCSGRTIGASQITEQPDGLYSAKLNAIGTCEKGSKRTPCTAYVRWRAVGTDAWTNGPPIEVDAKVTDRRGSQPVMGLDPNAEYEYQACGKEFTSDRVICAGPDGTSDTTQRFVVDANAGGQGEAPASQPASEASDASGGGLGGASLAVPALIAFGAMALLFGGMLWVTRGPAQSPPRPGSPTAATAPAPHADAGPPMEREPKAAGKNDAPAPRRRSERPPGERARKQSTAKERTLRNYERAVAQLEVVEADAAEADARASRAERLLTLQAEEAEGARRLREILDQIGKAERRMSEATAREQESLERAKE
jgi:hypothetical protein